MLNSVEHEKSFITSRPVLKCLLCLNAIIVVVIYLFIYFKVFLFIINSDISVTA